MSLDLLEEALSVKTAYMIHRTTKELFSSRMPEKVKANELFGQ